MTKLPLKPADSTHIRNECAFYLDEPLDSCVSLEPDIEEMPETI